MFYYYYLTFLACYIPYHISLKTKSIVVVPAAPKYSSFGEDAMGIVFDQFEILKSLIVFYII